MLKPYTCVVGVLFFIISLNSFAGETDFNYSYSSLCLDYDCVYFNGDGQKKFVSDKHSNIGYIFNGDIATPSRDDKYALSDRNGKFLTGFIYDLVFNFSKKPNQPNSNLTFARLDGKYGLINKVGKFIIPAEYDEQGGIHNNIIALKKDMKWILFNKMGRKIFTADSFYSCDNTDNISLIPVGKSGKYGYIDQEGNLEISLKYDMAYCFKENTAVVMSNKKYGVIDINGTEIVPINLDSVGFTSSATNLIKFKKNRKWGFLDTKNKVVIPAIYEAVDDFEDWNYTSFKQNDKWGFVNSEGKVVIEPQFDKVYDRYDKMVVVKKDEKLGIVSSNGNLIFSPQFDNVYPESHEDNLARVVKNNRWGLVDIYGKYVIPLSSNAISSFKDGLASINKKNKYDYINNKGEVVVKDLPNYLDENFNGLFLNRNTYEFINNKGIIVVSYDYICNGNIKVIKNYKGEILLPEKSESRICSDYEAEQKRQTQQRQTYSNSSRSSRPSYVMVSADCTGGHCTIKDMSLSGPSNVSITNNSNLNYESIHPLSNSSVAGNYRYSIRLDSGKVCSGSTYIDGTKSNVTINVYSHNCQANVSSY